MQPNKTLGGHRGLWIFLGEEEEEQIGTNAIKEASPLLIWGLSNPQPPHVRYRGKNRAGQSKAKQGDCQVYRWKEGSEMEGSTTEGHVVGIPVSSRAYGIEEPEFPEEQTPDHGEFPSSFQSSYGESRTPALYLFDFGSLQAK